MYYAIAELIERKEKKKKVRKSRLLSVKLSTVPSKQVPESSVLSAADKE